MSEKRDYRDTVFLPKTDFPMKAGLPQKEPGIAARWESDGLYQQLREARADRDRIRAAAARALADQVIAKLPEGYDQMVGKRFARGLDLSGGEWQKLAIARAYMRDAQVLVLDEPTAALDARAEFEVFQRFKDLSQGRTALLISHRFSSVRMADRIAVVEDGHVLDEGTHDELVAREGRYRELFDLQAQGYR